MQVRRECDDLDVCYYEALTLWRRMCVVVSCSVRQGSGDTQEGEVVGNY